MGRISPAYSADCTFAPPSRYANPSDSLSSPAALADLNPDSVDRTGDLVAREAACEDSQRDLTALLAPLHEQPSELAARLYSRFGSIAQNAQVSEPELWQSTSSRKVWIDAFSVVRRLLDFGMREELIRPAAPSKSCKM